jgi:hypothetical protein
MPFGAAASVLHFNRVSRAIWLLGAKELNLPWLNFFDDYPIIFPQQLTKACDSAISLLFNLIGWQISDDPKKCPPFAEQFSALGVSFSVGYLAGSISYVANLQSRVEKVREMLADIIAKKTMTLKQSEILRGKLQHMDSQVFGRIGKMMKPLYDSSCVAQHLDDWVLTVLLELDTWLVNSRPRTISPPAFGPTFLLFTDGASEFAGGKLELSIGAVLFTQSSLNSQVISSSVPPTEVEHWQRLEQTSKLRNDKHKDKVQFITEAELVAVLVSLNTWKHMLYLNRLIIFVDSDPAKFSLIRGTSQSHACACVCRRIHLLISEWSMHVWFTRVPTKSNPADDPSRGHPEITVQTFRSELVDCQWP